jgi:hypothetical protein
VYRPVDSYSSSSPVRKLTPYSSMRLAVASGYVRLLVCGSLLYFTKLFQLRHCSGCLVCPTTGLLAAFALGCRGVICHIVLVM